MSIFGEKVTIPKSQQAESMAKGAISMFTTATQQLVKSNELANSVVEENNAKIAKLNEENISMDNTMKANSKIISNINKLLGVEDDSDAKADNV